MMGFALRLVVMLGLILAWPVAAAAQQLGVGQRVVIGSTGETGTVLQIGQATVEGGVMVKVRLDKPGGPTLADQEVWYNSRSSRVTPVPADAPRQAAPQPPAQPAEAKGQLEVGDRVRIGSLGVNGTVEQIGGVLGNGAMMIRVQIDRDASKYPGVSNWYDTISSKITRLPN